MTSQPGCGLSTEAMVTCPSSVSTWSLTEMWGMTGVGLVVGVGGMVLVGAGVWVAAGVLVGVDTAGAVGVGVSVMVWRQAARKRRIMMMSSRINFDKGLIPHSKKEVSLHCAIYTGSRPLA